VSLTFAKYVSAVEGRLVSRWDAGPHSYIGARVTSMAERATGAEPIVWDTAVVLPLTAEFCQRFERELRDAIRNGDLIERSAAEYQGWLQVEKKRDEEQAAAAQKAAEPAKKAAKKDEDK
jgi:hypothetical protein